MSPRTVPLAVRVDSADPSRSVITLTGEVDVTTVGLLGDAIASVLPTPTLTVDVAGLTFIDSTGFSALLEARRAAPSTSFELVNPSDHVAHLVEVLGLSDVFAVRTSV